MTRAIYLSVVTIHVVSAIFWLGGMFFLGAIGAPLMRSEDPETRRRLFQAIGLRFRKYGWAALTLLFFTGVLIIWDRGWLTALADPAFRETTIGTALMWKIGLVVTMMTLSALHDFWLGPLAGRASVEPDRATRIRKWGAWGARVNVLLGLALVWVAVRLARGG